MFEKYTHQEYRNDIQGLRALGSLIIMVFHIWFNKVSGGVDVFFVISGFLMASILLKDYFSKGIKSPFPFWGGIIKRVAPSAYLVLGVTLILVYFLTPPGSLDTTVNEVIASILHVENIQLMRKAVDYLQTDAIPSPVQQFWALSLQIQFYIVLPFIIIPLAYISQKTQSSLALVVGVCCVISLSFIYAIISVSNNPSTSYFSPMSRVWEFFCGVLTFLLVSNLNKIRYQDILGCIGLCLIIGGAIFIPRGAGFPGTVSLIPVIGAVLIILSGVKYKTGAASRILSSRALVFLGNISFTIYLWHWPILIFYKEYFNTSTVSLSHGLIIISLSILLAYVSSRWVEMPFKKIPRKKVLINFSVGALFFLPIIASAIAVKYEINATIRDYKQDLESKEIVPYRYEKIFSQNDTPNFSRDYLLSLSKVYPMSYTIGCNQEGQGVEAKTCSFGDLEAKKDIVLVGSSHATQWLPVLDKIGKKNKFKIINMTKSSCPFGVLDTSDKSCHEWNKEALAKIESLKPYAVIVNSSKTSSSEKEFIPESFVNSWKSLANQDIKVIGIRDNPRFAYNIPDCAYKNRNSSNSNLAPCSISRQTALLASNPADQYPGIIHNIDLSNMFCTDDRCLAYFDNKVIYRDSNHLAVEYTYFIQSELERQLLAVID